MQNKEISGVLGCRTHGYQEYDLMEASVDSRTVNRPEMTLFFALCGLNHDGHDYIAELYGKGVRNFVVSTMRPEFDRMEGAVFYEVDDVLDALQKLAAWHRAGSRAEVVAVAGSNGKTVVKEWIYQLLSDEPGIYRSPRSYNSQVGVPLSLLGIPPECRLAVIETGISRPGEMIRLEHMVRPETGIFTHLGDAHGENFRSREQKLQEKALVFKECKWIIGRCGAPMDYILSTLPPQVHKLLWGGDADAGLRVLAQHVEKGKRQVDVLWKGGRTELCIPFADEASYENCMNTVCLLLKEGYTMGEIGSRLGRLQPIAMRLEIKEGSGHSILINDFYNSDASSFRPALSALKMQDAGREKVVVLSDFVDTGRDEAELYREVAHQLEQAGVSLFVGVGNALVRHRNLFHLPVCRFYADTEQFLKQEERESYRNRVVLIKGARRFRFEYIAGFLQKQSHTTVLEVDMDAMVHNLNYFRSLLPPHTRIAVMVKAFSYGSGSVEIANLLQYQGVDYLMVAFADEGVELRAAGINVPIGVMNPEPEAFDNMIEFNLEPEIYSMELLEAFDSSLLKHGIEHYPVHLKLNTGMNRSGLNEEELPRLIRFFGSRRQVMLRSMFSHLAGSDEEVHDSFTREQVRRFCRMTEEIQSHFDYRIIRHILNSAGIERFGEYAFDMVRLGIGLHGISAVGAPLVPVSSFKTYIAAIRNVKAGETVGYGRKGKVERDSRIAVIPVGYADGLDRHLSCGVGEVMVRGRRMPLVGNICMDACMIDVTGTEVETGDEVEIFGKHIPVTELSDKLGTIPYEILTSVSQRVKRIYYLE